MKRSRREFIKAGVAGGAVLASTVAHEESARAAEKTSGSDPLRVLVLGGTGFIGPHMVREFLRRGHEVSLFNRGRSNDELFPDLRLFLGDRNGDLDSLKGHGWDAVVDNSGYVPRHVRDSARLLAPVVSHYLFISSISAYASFATPNDEDSLLGKMSDESVEEVTGETYGPMKALCEARAREEIGEERLTVLRPTYVCGPGDRTDRFTYWPVRTMRGGEMLWPGTPDDPVQIIDVRDLAFFTVDCIERRIAGVYNTVTPVGSCTMGQLQTDCLAVTAAEVTPVWVDGGFLRERGLVGDLPIWAPPEGELGAIARVSGRRAFERGLQTRPPRETARDTLDWWRTLPEERRQALRAGPTAEQEAALLRAWRERQG